MTQKIRWGILSTARIGEHQVIPAIRQSNNGQVVAVASRNLERGKTFADRLDIPKAYGSYEELLADPGIDAVYIPLPNDQHYTWAIRCAEAGKNVLCEKPMTLNVIEAEQLAQNFEMRGLLLAEAFMYRFHPQTEKVKQLLNAGTVGKVGYVQSTFSFYINNEDDIRLKPDMGGGSLMDVGCYCLNIILYLVGEEPAQVQAYAEFGERSQVDENVVGILSFPSGVLAQFNCGFRRHFTQSYEIRGTHGRLVVERGFVPFRPDESADNVLRLWHSVPGTGKEEYEEIKIEKVNQYILMVEDFADALLNKRSPRFPIQDSIATMRAIDQVRAAARQNSAQNGN